MNILYPVSRNGYFFPDIEEETRFKLIESRRGYDNIFDLFLWQSTTEGLAGYYDQGTQTIYGLEYDRRYESADVLRNSSLYDEYLAFRDRYQSSDDDYLLKIGKRPFLFNNIVTDEGKREDTTQFSSHDWRAIVGLVDEVLLNEYSQRFHIDARSRFHDEYHYGDSIDYPAQLHTHFTNREDVRQYKLLLLASRDYPFSLQDKAKLFTLLEKDGKLHAKTNPILNQINSKIHKIIRGIRKRFVFSSLYRPYDHSNYKQNKPSEKYKKLHNLLYFRNLSNRKPKAIKSHQYRSTMSFSAVENYIAATGHIKAD